MSLNQKENRRKIKTQISSSQSLPKFRLSSSKKVFHLSKPTQIVSELRQFPEKWQNSSIILKKASINLDVAKRISTIGSYESIGSSKKILPHPIHLRKSLIKIVDPFIQKKMILKQDNLVHITAQKWLIFDCLKSKPLKGYKYKKLHNIADISKILTFYTAYAIIKEYRIIIDKTDLIVIKEDEEILGKKINLRNQNILTLEDCLYGVLLNDSSNLAYILTNNLGFLCQRRRQNKYFSCFDIKRENRKKNINFFVSLMQVFASKLQLNDTYINNFRGLCKIQSNAKDIAKLFQACWQIPLFQKIMSIKQRQISIKYINHQGDLSFNKIMVKSTNQMQKYSQNCKGCKTGENTIGGHSLVSYFQNSMTNKKYIIVVLGSYGKQQKFKDTQLLYEWIESFSK